MEILHFEREFREFSSRVYPQFGETEFLSFRDGAARGWEGYKPKLRARALEILAPEKWDAGTIGSGEILERAIKAIEIEGEGDSRNNLVSWEGRYGPTSAGHTALLAARADRTRSKAFDQWFWDAFREEVEPADHFDRFRLLAGNGYQLVAYIYFLLDADRFAPIAPRTFDNAFTRLGIDLKTSGQCSWANYVMFNEAIENVRRLMVQKPGLSDATHIDAHSFLWMMVRMPEELAKHGTSASIGRHLGGRSRSVVEMALNAFAAAQQSGKTSVRTHKNKEVGLARKELEELIDCLIDEQLGLCAITKLPLQWRGESEDDAMLASLDRIDSNGHYERGNTQVVCRFINRWKSDTPDGEFRRLLGEVQRAWG